MYTVLLPIDENPKRAKAQAAYVATLPDAANAVDVTILHVFADDDSLDPDDDEIKRDPKAVDSVKLAMEFLDDEGISYAVLKDRADPIDAILDQAEELEVDAIVLGGRKRSPAGKVLFGSHSMSILRNTDTPVVLTGIAE